MADTRDVPDYKYNRLRGFQFFYVWRYYGRGIKLNRCSSTKYLGLILDEDLNWKPHIQYLQTKLSPELESSRTSLASRTHFEVLSLGLEASSPWPWPRSLRSSKIALSSTRGQHYFLNRWNFVEKRQKPREKFTNTFFIFRNWSIGLAKRASQPNWNFTNDKNVTKNRGGVLEDTFWRPWPWPRGLKSSKIVLSSARGQHYF